MVITLFIMFLVLELIYHFSSVEDRPSYLKDVFFLSEEHVDQFVSYIRSSKAEVW